jgi:hypothetical protein
VQILSVRFLGFLIRDPIRTVLLHKAGVSVTVPAPERYAVHKLIVASMRRTDGQGALKRNKDIQQSALLIEALSQARRHSDLTLVYTETWERGPAWQDGLRAGAGLMTAEGRERLRDCLRTGGTQIGEDVTLPF